MNLENMTKEKMYEIAMAKEFGQEFVDKIKLLPDKTHLNIMVTRMENRTLNIQIHAIQGF